MERVAGDVESGDLGVGDLDALGGGGSTTVGGTIKLFYDTLSGTVPGASGTDAAGRVYDAGVESWEAP